MSLSVRLSVRLSRVVVQFGIMSDESHSVSGCKIMTVKRFVIVGIFHRVANSPSWYLLKNHKQQEINGQIMAVNDVRVHWICHYICYYYTIICSIRMQGVCTARGWITVEMIKPTDSQSTILYNILWPYSHNANVKQAWKIKYI